MNMRLDNRVAVVTGGGCGIGQAIVEVFSAPITAEPIIFGKAANTVVGPHDEILIPRGSRKTDWEVELGVVIGRTARYLSSEIEASTRIAGYCICDDVSGHDGNLRQQGTTSTMIFGVAHLVHYVSQFMTFEAGDLISTGTPLGVGMERKPPEYLRAEDIVELEIEGLGHQKQSCVQA